MSVFLRTPYNYDMSKVSDETGLLCSDPSLTQQQFAEESDINNIVDRFMKTGHIPTPTSMPQYADYEGIFDFQSAMNVVRQADENFMRMDAKIRARFHNSPQEFPTTLRRRCALVWLFLMPNRRTSLLKLWSRLKPTGQRLSC